MFEKEEFIQKIDALAAFGEKERALTYGSRRLELDIEEIEGKISAIQDDLVRAILMRRVTKEKKRQEIARLDEQIEEKRRQIDDLQTQIRALTMESFGTEEIPPVYFGRYPQGADGEVLPLEWDVLYRKDRMILLVTRQIIEHMPYAEEMVDTPWADSCIRKWLNGEFLHNWFTEEERSLIFEKELANPGNDPYKTPESENTIDRIFLPSIQEVKRYSEFDQDRIATATPYARKKGVTVNEETGGSYWWLRSNGGNMYNAALVNFTGYVFEYGFYVVSERYGVRPSMWIMMDKK